MALTLIDKGIIQFINNMKNANPIGWKTIELPFLFRNLGMGSVLCVGERNGFEGILECVFSKNASDITCTDIEDIQDENGSVFCFHKEGKIKYIKIDFIKFPQDTKYDNVICINVLEHFGFSGPSALGGSFNLFYDFKGFEKMLELSRKKIILSVPYSYRIFTDDNIHFGERKYTEERINLFKNIAYSKGFNVEKEELWVDEGRKNDFLQINNKLFSQRQNHRHDENDYLIMLVFQKSG